MEEVIRAVVHKVGAARGPQLAPLADFLVQLLMLRVGAAGEPQAQPSPPVTDHRLLIADR